MLKLVRIIRLLRLIKLVRLVRGARILKRWESKLAINYSTLTLWQSQPVQKCRAHSCLCGRPPRPNSLPTCSRPPPFPSPLPPWAREEGPRRLLAEENLLFGLPALSRRSHRIFFRFRQCLVGLLLFAHWFACVWAMQVAGPNASAIPSPSPSPSPHSV